MAKSKRKKLSRKKLVWDNNVCKMGTTYHYRFYYKGKPFQGDTKMEDKRDAVAVVRKLKDRYKGITSTGELDAKIAAEMSDVPRIPIHEIWDELEEPPGDAVNSKSRWDDFVGFAYASGIRTLNQINSQIAEDYIKHLKKHGRWQRTVNQQRTNKKGHKYEVAFTSPQNISLSTVLKFQKACHCVLGKALKGSRTANPFKLDKIETNPIDREAFSETQIQAMYEHADPFCLDIVRMGVLTGRRRNEICNLKWSDIQFEGKRSDCIKPQKVREREDGSESKRTGRMPIRGELAEYITELVARRDAILNNPKSANELKGRARVYVLPEHYKVFRGKNGESKSKGVTVSRRFKQMLERVAEKSGVPFEHQAKVPNRDRMATVLDIHSLRHTCIFRMARKLIPIETAMEYVGHMSKEVHKKYRSHFSTEQLARIEELQEAELAAHEAKVAALNGIKVPNLPEMTGAAGDLDEDALFDAFKSMYDQKDPAQQVALITRLMSKKEADADSCCK